MVDDAMFQFPFHSRYNNSMTNTFTLRVIANVHLELYM